ncbi:hydroxymethylglutaryl-CoA reductase, degradative [Lacticaseibacillus baoqingensis]|uniref:3-hydroxy-3-methylglutaryl coenzyme A reductase n=1 Tax=Lacticaseibacillus baoqingensis TaxID=2486013 RepID=A0ABW4E311_9LACO|nr:hydroxymethylglutaryl-CoA reductase, degradative [Lacticaseibacillus baoqingensis]
MKFYQLDAATRRKRLTAEGYLTPEEAAAWAQPALPSSVAEALSENIIGEFALPLGIARDLVVNGKLYQVPMATEEPSVVAAASNGARLAGLNGGVKATTEAHLVTGEIVFADLAAPAQAQALIAKRQGELLTQAQAAHPSIVQRGGGVKAITTTIIGRFLKIAVVIDTQAAMGANIVNTICEHLAAVLQTWLQQPALVAILSNASKQLTTATVHLTPASLATKTISGEQIAARIVLLSELAQVDGDRAVTHNKGILNGIVAAVLASGNDTRAVAASIGAYAAQSGQYQPLSTWKMVQGQLVGELTLPLTVGVVGGAISALPRAQAVKQLGHYTSVAVLQTVLASLGLVQNLAALRALAGPGIQAGHMALQANALAMAAGAKGAEIAAVATALQTRRKDLATAQAILAEIRKKG